MQRLAVNFGPQTRFTDAEFDRLFLDHYSQITAAAYRLVGDPDEAEELAAETFWKLWQKPPNGQENILGWLYRVVINLGYNHLRSFKRRGRYEESAFTDTHLTSSPANPQDELERMSLVANHTDNLVIIDPKTGKITGEVDLSGLNGSILQNQKEEIDVLNGIAWNPVTDKIYVTGKLWPKLFEIKLIRK